MSRPSPDDHDEAYLEDRRRAALADDDYDESDDVDEDDGADGRRPNYAARRTAVVVAVTILIGIAVAVLVVPRGDGPLVLDEPEWNAVVDVARATGEIEVIGADGRRLVTITGQPRATELFTDGNHIALAVPDGLLLVDISTGRRREVQIERSWQTTRLDDTAAFVLLSAPRITGTVAIIDATTGRQIDIAAVADQRNPLLIADSVRSDPTGRAFAVGDGRNFQTIIVSFDDDEPAYVAGAPLALGDEIVITAATIGPSAELGIFDRTGTRRAAITSPPPVGGVLAGDRFVYITDDGQVLSVDADSDRPTERGLIPLPGGDEVTDVRPVAGGERLVAGGERFVTVVDLDGEIIHQAALPIGLQQPLPTGAWRCLPVVLTDRIIINDLVDGAALAEIGVESTSGSVAVSLDGCGVAVDGVFVSPAGTRRFGTSARQALPTPDGDGVVIVGADGRARLVTIGSDDTVELGEVGTLIGFATR